MPGRRNMRNTPESSRKNQCSNSRGATKVIFFVYHTMFNYFLIKKLYVHSVLYLNITAHYILTKLKPQTLSKDSLRLKYSILLPNY